MKTVVDDFGPLHGFWLFAYERYNGVLGNYPNNNKSIEPQLMKKFLHFCRYSSLRNLVTISLSTLKE